MPHQNARARVVSISGPKFSLQAFVYFSAWKCAVFGLIFVNLWLFYGESALPPNGTHYHLLMIFIAAHFSAKLAYYCSLPPLVGMLISGFIYGNFLSVEFDHELTSTLRSMALMVILLRAGFNVNPSKIIKLSFVCFRLSIIPSLIEALTMATCGYYLFDLSLSWSIMLGFVVASVSPAIDVPEMIECRRENLGVSKGMPTLIIASASMDNVFAITGFSVALSLAFASATISTQSTWIAILKGPAEAVIGIAFGTIAGFGLWYLPESCDPYPKSISTRYDLHRFIILILAATFALLANQKFDLGGSGPLAILVMAFVASLRWKPFGFVDYIEDCLKRLWLVLELYLFCLIAADVRVQSLQTHIIYYGLPCLVGAILLRMVTAFVVSYGIGLNVRERLFIAIAWFPKASVQAAIGSIALDRARNQAEKDMGRLVLTMAVLSIILTAPLGALIIDYCAHRLLSALKIDQRARSPMLYGSNSYENNDDQENNKNRHQNGYVKIDDQTP